MKKPRYFCEHCGKEVRRDAPLCPYCGRFFSSVRCPKCGFSGDVAEFDSGCPVCGYAEAATAAPEPFKAPPETVTPLPIWVYIAAAAALVAAVLLLLQALR
jgi:predicted amidophosphoribosyltransferase